MFGLVNYILVFLGAALMVVNIVGFIRFARYVKTQDTWNTGDAILYLPIALLVMFLLGYLAVGLFGQPDLIMAGILFGGSIFVFIMYRYLSSITKRIVESKRIEATLVAVEESNKAKMDFLDNMSHEMRTPLNVILGMDSIALKDPALSEETRGRLEKISFSAQHLLKLIDNILDMNRIDAGMLATSSEVFRLSDTLGQVNAIASAQCEEKGLVYEGADEMGEDCYFVGDDLQLKRVLLSILDNAIKYTEAPGTVSMTMERTSDSDRFQTLRFAVSDTGVGIDEDFLPRVFDVFSQEDESATKRHGGAGLSLSLAKNIVELMGGTIEVASKKNVGTTFTVTVRMVTTDPEETEAGDFEPLETLEDTRILIVEDLPENAEIVADLLDLEGAKSEHAENGKIALSMFEQSPEGYYDAILMDLRMPVMDGLEATRHIRALDRVDAKTIPILALTANASAGDVRKSLEAGMNVHLAKPTDSDELYLNLRQQIQRPTRPKEGLKHD